MKRNCLIVSASIMLLNSFVQVMPAIASGNQVEVHTESDTTALNIDPRSGQLRHDGSEGVRMFAQRGTVWFFSQKTGLNLVYGRLLVDATTSAITIKTQDAMIEVSKRGHVGVEASDGVVRVQSLSDADEVKVIACGEVISLGLGQEALFTKAAPITADTYPLDGVGRRFLFERKLADGRYYTSSDFSIANYLKYVPTAIEMRKEHGKLAADLMKSCCALEYVLRNRPSYKLSQPATCVASNGGS